MFTIRICRIAGGVFFEGEGTPCIPPLAPFFTHEVAKLGGGALASKCVGPFV
nr:MAG TPA: hypothetical protein [Caudoviricetes sp.]